eukprot:gene30836-38640_t
MEARSYSVLLEQLSYAKLGEFNIIRIFSQTHREDKERTILAVTIVSVSVLAIMGLLSPREPSFVDAATVEEFALAHQTYGNLKNLVIVAGHAVYIGTDFTKADDMDSWFLEDYQRIPGQVESFIEHISQGVEAAAKDPSALLLFSGGETRHLAGPLSEGASYWFVANGLNWF